MVKNISLKAARVNAQMTRPQAAAGLGVHTETLAKYERDSTKVPLTFMLKIEDVYKIPAGNIFFGTNAEQKEAFESGTQDQTDSLYKLRRVK